MLSRDYLNIEPSIHGSKQLFEHNKYTRTMLNEFMIEVV